MKMTKEGFHAGWGGEQKSNVFFTQHVYLVKDMYKMYMWLVFYLRSRCRGRPNLGLKDHFELFAELHNLKEIADFKRENKTCNKNNNPNAKVQSCEERFRWTLCSPV